MSEPKIYCNIVQCKYYRYLKEPHQKKGRPGFTPLPGTDKFSGFCGKVGEVGKKSKGITFIFKALLSSTKLLQKLALCGRFGFNESIGPKEGTPEDRVSCSNYDCFFNTAGQRGEIGGCRKMSEGDPLYVDWTKIFTEDGEMTWVPNCVSAADRRFEGHIDWAKAAVGNRAGAPSSTLRPQTRPSIRGKW